MASVQVRAATLDDTQAISALFRARISAWQRLNAQGQVEDVAYERLTIYERWLHGGPYMSVETAALHLSHLLRGAGIPAVAELHGRVVAYIEIYHGLEPEPFGDHLHLGEWVLTAEQSTPTVEDALIHYLLDQARAAHCQRVTAHMVANDAALQAIYARHGMMSLARQRRFSMPAKSGQGFYKTDEHPTANPTQIAGWCMSVGRFGSARQQWETLWPRTFNALPELRDRRIHRLRLSAAGQEALVCCQQQLYAPRSADIYVWSPKTFTPQMLTALRDWTHREGYRSLVMLVTDETAKVLGAEAEADGYYQDVYGVNV